MEKMNFRDFVKSDYRLIKIAKQWYLKLGEVKEEWILVEINSATEALMMSRDWETSNFWIDGVGAETLISWLLEDESHECVCDVKEIFEESATKVEFVSFSGRDGNYGFFAVEVERQGEKTLKVLPVDWEANTESNPDLYLLKQVIKHFSPEESEKLQEVESEDYDFNDIKDIELLKLCILATYEKTKTKTE